MESFLAQYAIEFDLEKNRVSIDLGEKSRFEFIKEVDALLGKGERDLPVVQALSF